MNAERPWVRGDLTWIRSGPLYRIHRSAQQDLDAFLGRFPYRRFDLDGRAMTSRSTAHAELARVLGFPDYYGMNWDAFHDCFGDFASEHSGELIAVVWDHLDVAADAAPATAVEVGWALLECKLGPMVPRNVNEDWLAGLDIFALGDGVDFDRP